MEDVLIRAEALAMAAEMDVLLQGVRVHQLIASLGEEQRILDIAAARTAASIRAFVEAWNAPHPGLN